MRKYDMLRGIKKGGTLCSTVFGMQKKQKTAADFIKRTLAEKKINHISSMPPR
jgi:hypothetical protein